MRTFASALLVVVLAGACLSAGASDWPQFLGPDRNGIAPEGKLAKSWPAGGPKILWTLLVGEGFGGPAVQGGKVYILDRTGDRSDVLRCIDFAGGKEDWQFAYDAPGSVAHPGSRSTPTVDEKYVFTIGPFGDIYCVDKATHKAVWNKHLLNDFASGMHQWGVSQSPLLYKDWIIIAPLGREVGVAALEKATGKVVWKSAAFGGLRYHSPILTTIGDVEQVVMASGSNVAGVDVKDGRVLWSYGGYRCSIPVPSPAPVGGGRLFVTGGYDAGSVMIQVEKAGDKFAAKELWRDRGLGAQIHNAILWQDHLYVNCNTNSRQDGLVCFDLDGHVKWKTGRAPNFERGNVILVDGTLVIMDGSSGALRLVQPDPKGYKELASAKILGGGAWGAMAFADGKLVCRDHKQMKCVDLAGKE